MYKRILSATVSIGEETASMTYFPSVNILGGRNRENVVLTLAGIFGGITPKAFKAVLNWQDDAILFVSGHDGRVFVDFVKSECGDSAQIMKEFHKQRFFSFRNTAHILDGAHLPDGISGAGDLLLQKLHDTLAKEDDRPLFVCNFLERLDESVDLRPILEALNATGKQVFIAVPHYYNMKQQEEIPYDIHTL